jgi:hypothetical protein
MFLSKRLFIKHIHSCLSKIVFPISIIVYLSLQSVYSQSFRSSQWVDFLTHPLTAATQPPTTNHSNQTQPFQVYKIPLQYFDNNKKQKSDSLSPDIYFIEDSSIPFYALEVKFLMGDMATPYTSLSKEAHISQDEQPYDFSRLHDRTIKELKSGTQLQTKEQIDKL